MNEDEITQFHDDLMIPLEADLGYWGNAVFRIWLHERPDWIVEQRNNGTLISELLKINERLSQEQFDLRKELQDQYIKDQPLKTSTRLELENQISIEVNSYMQYRLKGVIGVLCE